jgi:hypothetical protein
MTEAEQFLEANYFKPQRAYDYQHFKDYDSQIELRQQFSARFGLAILDTRTLNLVRSFSPLLEVGAGSGYWAHELRKAGADIIPTDPGTGKFRQVLAARSPGSLSRRSRALRRRGAGWLHRRRPFHDILDADYECENHYIPQFMHIHDRLYVCRRKKA